MDSLTKSVAKIEARLEEITLTRALKKANKFALFWESFFIWFMNLSLIILIAFCVLLLVTVLLGADWEEKFEQ